MFFTDSCKLLCFEKYISYFSSIQSFLLGCSTNIFSDDNFSNCVRNEFNKIMPALFFTSVSQNFGSANIQRTTRFSRN